MNWDVLSFFGVMEPVQSRSVTSAGADGAVAEYSVSVKYRDSVWYCSAHAGAILALRAKRHL